MRSNTLIMLGASLAFGTLAVILARSWIASAVEDEFRDVPLAENFVPAETFRAATTTVVVASHDIAFGEPLSPSSFQLADYPEDLVPLGTFETVEDIFQAAPGAEPLSANIMRVALRDIRAYAPLFDDEISGPGETAALSATIRPGYVASAVPVDQNTGVGGFVVPGDLVDVMHITQRPNTSEPEIYDSTILLQAVRVLGVDQNAARIPDPSVARTVTLEVDRRDLQVLALAELSGRISLALRGTGETQLIVAPDMRSDRLARAARVSTPKPVIRRKPKPKPAAEPADDRARVKIVRGDIVERVTVRREHAVQAASLESSDPAYPGAAAAAPSTDDAVLAGGR